MLEVKLKNYQILHLGIQVPGIYCQILIVTLENWKIEDFFNLNFEQSDPFKVLDKDHKISNFNGEESTRVLKISCT